MTKIKESIEIADTGINLGTVAAGIIIESGSNSNGSWTKWANGTMICSNIDQYSFTVPNKIGPLWYGYVNDLGPFPQSFIERPDIVYSHFNTADIIAIQPYDFQYGVTATKAGGCYPIGCCQRLDPISIKIGYLAIGKWK